MLGDLDLFDGDPDTAEERITESLAICTDTASDPRPGREPDGPRRAPPPSAASPRKLRDSSTRRFRLHRGAPAPRGARASCPRPVLTPRLVSHRLR